MESLVTQNVNLQAYATRLVGQVCGTGEGDRWGTGEGDMGTGDR